MKMLMGLYKLNLIFCLYNKVMMEQSWFSKVLGTQEQLSGNDIEALQGQLSQRTNFHLLKTVCCDDVIFTCANGLKDGCGFLLWFRKEDSKRQPTLYKLLVDLSHHDGGCDLNPSENDQSPEGSLKEIHPNTQTPVEESADKLYSENEIGLLKKQLEFSSKGLLSKSTDIDHQHNLITTIRFKCKNFPYANICPFLHILQYKCHLNHKPYYIHKAIESQHLPQCIMDDENIQYNVTARKIDASMHILEQIVQEDPTIKPKTILQRFGERLGEQNEEFLYEGLTEKNIKRSIKKYFDNAVAKAKNKLREK